MSDEQARKKQEFERLLGETVAKADQYETLSNELGKYARLAKDVARPMHDAVRQSPERTFSIESLNQGIEVLTLWHERGPDVHELRTDISSFAANTLSVASVSTGMLSGVLSGSVFVPGQREAVEKVAGELQITFNRFPLVEDAKRSMKRLKLDKTTGSYRSALELLSEAHEALDRPATGEGSPLHVLISLRECIAVVLSELLRRRPSQSPASNPSDKVSSIGSQCGRLNLTPNYFDSIAITANATMKCLSGAKQGQMTRAQINEAFNNTVLFLNAFLSGLDETLLKP